MKKSGKHGVAVKATSFDQKKDRRGGWTPSLSIISKRRKKNKLAKASRKRNRK